LIRTSTIGPGDSLVAFEIGVVIWAIAALAAAWGIVVLVRMYETHARHDRTPVPDDADLES
jgi:hypothetical protein